MTHFASWRSYTTFSQLVKHQERFSRSQVVSQFLSAVSATSEKRLTTVEGGEIYWRAQLGCEWVESEPRGKGYETPVPFSASRMVPLRHSPGEGRVNPVGIPVLYLASNATTALSEVRPWIGKIVTLAEFKTNYRLRVLDCSSDNERPFFIGGEPDPEAREVAVWGAINLAFSQPASADDDRTTYIPTQLLAEHFREIGAEGVVYNSSLGSGKNIALFSLDAATLLTCSTHVVRSVSFTHESVSDPNLERRHRPR